MRTSAIHCDRCGQGPLATGKVAQLNLSPELATKTVEALGAVDAATMLQVKTGTYCFDLCPMCSGHFVRFMARNLNL